MKYDASGQKPSSHFIECGYKFLAISCGFHNGISVVRSYIAKKCNRKIYGHYNWQTASYEEESCK